jgi:hypothetical protein
MPADHVDLEAGVDQIHDATTGSIHFKSDVECFTPEPGGSSGFLPVPPSKLKLVLSTEPTIHRETALGIWAYH